MSSTTNPTLPPEPPRSLRIGLTGGIASGKTAVANLFAGLGIPVIDADTIAREVVEPGQRALDRIVERFGTEVLDTVGRLDRARMRTRVFTTETDRHALEAIVHPAVREEIIRRSQAMPSHTYHIIAIPLLVEHGLQSLVDRTLVVDAPEPIQMARLQTRDNMAVPEAARMIAAQASRNARLAAADDVIENTGTIADLELKVRQLHRHYSEIQHRLASGHIRPSTAQ